MHQYPAGADSEPVHLLVDSTGLKLCGRGEWLLEKHGTATRRSWRMLHLGVDAGTGRIVASTLTSKDVDDASQAGPLLDQVAGAVASFTADGAYDQDRVYDSVTQRHADAAVVVPPRATAVPSDTAETAPTQRDGHLQHIAKHGRMAWQNASGYNRRARVEATMSRWKQVIGAELRAHTDERRATEVAVAVHALNRMLDLERPSYVRRLIPGGAGVSASVSLIPAPRSHSRQAGELRAAKRAVIPSVQHKRHKGLNDRAENSHQPTR